MTDMDKLIETVAKALVKHGKDTAPKMAEVAIRAINASGDWKVVPVEPTEEMTDAWYEGYTETVSSRQPEGTYRAMIASAPTPEEK